jgi:hypothetical protein
LDKFGIMETIMTKNRKSHPRKKKGQKKSNQPLPATKSKADFTPTITDETQEGTSTVIVGGVQMPEKTKADFEPQVFDVTEEGYCEGWVGVPQPPKKTTRRRS